MPEPNFHKYTDLTELDFKLITGWLQHEQGSGQIGLKAEISLLANLTERDNASPSGSALMHKLKGGWFARPKENNIKLSDEQLIQSSTSNQLKWAKEVLVEGKRTLPKAIDEHDWIKDIAYGHDNTPGSITVNGKFYSSEIEKDRKAIEDKSNYIRNETVIQWKARYTFYCWIHKDSDPFGYTSKSRMKKFGTACYDIHGNPVDDIGLVLSSGNSDYSGSSSSDFTGLSSDSSGSIGIDIGQYQPEDGIIRQIAYLDDTYKPSLKESKLELSVINYTSLLFMVTGFTSDSGVNFTTGSGSTYDTSKLKGNCKKFIDFLIGKGFTAAGACGAAGNIYHESGFNPSSVNSKSGASGIVQWLGSRKAAMISKVPDWKNNFEGQLEFMWKELKSGYKSLISYFKSVEDTKKGVEAAAKYWSDKYERPETWYPIRADQGKKYFEKIKITSGTGSGELVGKSGKKLSVKKTIITTSENCQITRNYLNYNSWGTTWNQRYNSGGRLGQHKMAHEWIAQNKPTDNQHIATLAGHRICCMRAKNAGIYGIANAGELCKVIFKDGSYITVLIGDEKGGDAGNHYGHPWSGNVIDMCEWCCDESKGGMPPNPPEVGKKVVKVENYGSWIDN